MSLDVLTQVWSLVKTFTQVPAYHLLLEGILFVVIGGLLVRRVQNRSRKVRAEKFCKEEEEELLSEWEPEPLVPEYDLNHPALHVPVLDQKAGKYLNIFGEKCINFSTHNYLGFAGNQEIEQAAIECVKQYGVGSCGPRAFYGTADVHVHLEEKLAEFFGAEQAVLYSYGFSTISSAIPAYAKKGDVIFADEMVQFPIQKAFDASRSKIRYFKHNNVDHLEQLLLQQAQEDKKNPKQAKVSRRFLVVEGIYMNTGSICKLDQMIAIKKKYKLRLMIDETISFGTLGANGRGITEHFNISISDVDLIMATLEHSMGSIGGFCVGSSYVVEHQTLAGLGYCFSASLPPMFAAAVLKAIELMENNIDMFEELRKKCIYVTELFTNMSGIELVGDSISPIKHIRLKSPYLMECREEQTSLLRNLVDKAREKKIALVLASYLEHSEVSLPPVSIRVAISNLLTEQDIAESHAAIKDIVDEMFL
ncbi:serine palmitoyltransferase 1 [Lepeophtheirus salmonis]|uniref:serine palmitoyltransferase 1 n=1 Tax=Lepeophtheirus salmonis TaxID=72036 RepID=UPI001AEB6E84|nr:serine palmitoyltransferase 1-like [Lepeophtheirus salmonis]XP_040583982.1 serine palmitoyltransferase 1-like [Lepeophtheirus salmonis]XP_040583983.1 serine palmitoyltransferase 1-like [Lepeophtheirus salmonis]XP_040583984.1 serine palmitoyltransferase 1-like [Lepeophtheirus salmonis]